MEPHTATLKPDPLVDDQRPSQRQCCYLLLCTLADHANLSWPARHEPKSNNMSSLDSGRGSHSESCAGLCHSAGLLTRLLTVASFASSANA